MSLKSNLPIILAIAMSVAITSCSNLRKVDCNGEPVYIPKNPDKYYKDEISSWELSLKASIGQLKQVEGLELSPTIKKNVVSKREKLDQLSSRLRDIIYASSKNVEMHPCDKSFARQHQDLLASIAKEVNSAEALKNAARDAKSTANLNSLDESKLKAALEIYDGSTQINKLTN